MIDRWGQLHHSCETKECQMRHDSIDRERRRGGWGGDLLQKLHQRLLVNGGWRWSLLRSIIYIEWFTFAAL